MSQTDPVWDELGKIDYFLEQLARAIERGDAPYSSYDAISPRFLERRADLTAIIEARSVRAPECATGPTAGSAATPTATPATAAAPAAVATSAAPAPAVSQPVRPAPPSAVGFPVAPSAPARHVSAGAWMAYTGALLVVIAVAIFTVYAWATFPPLMKLAVLLGVTALFYVGGEAVRTRLDLPAVGVALVSVGSAMLLFDGWMVIRSTGATGFWPWAAVLLVCSLAYWATELRITGGWFGAIGAAAQVGWWWLLGQALGLESYWVAAGVSLVAVAWSMPARRVPEASPFRTLARILESGAVVLAVATTAASAMGSVAAQFERVDAWSIVAAAVTALAVAFVIERLVPRPRGLSVIAQAGLFAAVAAVWIGAEIRGGGALPGWPVLAALGAMALAYDLYAPRRGSGPYALAGLVAEAFLWLALGERFEWRAEIVFALFLAFGLSAVIVARLAGQGTAEAGPALDPATWPGAVWSSRVWRWGGLTLMGASTLLLPTLGLPLSGVAIGWRESLLAAWALAAWVAASGLLRGTVPGRMAGRIALLASYYALASSLASAFPGWHSAYYALAMLGLAVLFSQARGAVARIVGVTIEEMDLWSKTSLVLLPVGGVLAAGAFFSVDSYPVAVLLGVAGAAWIAEGLRSGAWWVYGPASAALTSSAFVGSLTAAHLARSADASATAALCAAGAAVVLAGTGLLGSRRPGSWGSALALGGTSTAAVLALAVGPWFPGGVAASAMVLVAAAWALCAAACGLPGLAAASGLSLTASLLTALAWQDPSAWLTVVLMSALAAAQLLPRVLTADPRASRFGRAAFSLAVSGAATLAVLLAIGWDEQYFGRMLALGIHASWDYIPYGAFAVALAVAGAYVLTWTAVEQSEVGLYPGIGLLVFGALRAMTAWHVEQAELHLVLVALYVAGMGVLWATRKPGRTVPMLTDVAAFGVGVAYPLLIAIASPTASESLAHGLWALGLSLVAIAAGLFARTRVYFIGGILVLVADALWLSRGALLALPSWVWIGTIGLALIAGGVTYARREALEGVSRKLSAEMAGWR